MTKSQTEKQKPNNYAEPLCACGAPIPEDGICAACADEIADELYYQIADITHTEAAAGYDRDDVLDVIAHAAAAAVEKVRNLTK